MYSWEQLIEHNLNHNAVGSQELSGAKWVGVDPLGPTYFWLPTALAWRALN